MSRKIKDEPDGNGVPVKARILKRTMVRSVLQSDQGMAERMAWRRMDCRCGIDITLAVVDGLVQRQVPPKVEYSMTGKGAGIHPVY